VKLRLASVVGSDTSLLSSFLSHYSGLGVEEFSIVRHVDPRGDQDIGSSAAVMSDAGLRFHDVARTPWDEGLNRRLIRELMAGHPDDWWIVADLDEFQCYDQPLVAVVDLCERSGHDYVEGAFLDRVALDGALTGPDARPLDEQYPLAGSLTNPLMGGKPVKVTLARGDVVLDYGQHRALAGRPVPAEEVYAQVHHFKWTGSVLERLARRFEAYTSGEWRLLHRGVATESQLFLEHVATHDGHVDVSDPRFGFEKSGIEWRERTAWQDAMAVLRSHYAADDEQRRTEYAMGRTGFFA
jgi:hypothetical protein